MHPQSMIPISHVGLYIASLENDVILLMTSSSYLLFCNTYKCTLLEIEEKTLVSIEHN